MIFTLLLLYSDLGDFSITLPGNVSLQSDGSLLILDTNVGLAHCNQDGDIIRSFRTKGTGPGENMSFGPSLWNGQFYLITDELAQKTNIYDAYGYYIGSYPMMFSQMFYVAGKTLLTDTMHFTAKLYHPNLQ